MHENPINLELNSNESLSLMSDGFFFYRTTFNKYLKKQKRNLELEPDNYLSCLIDLNIQKC